MMIKVIGLGNPLYGDDAFGLHVIEELERRRLNNNYVELISLPTPSPWDIYEVLREGEFFIIIDAMESGEEGKVELFSINEIQLILSYFKTIHDININQVLDYLKLNDINTNGVVVAVKGNSFHLSVDLSEKMKQFVNIAANKVEEVLESYLSKNLFN